MKTLILASAPETEYDYVRQLAQQAEYIICADGGTRHAAACGIRPDLVIGDFDSGARPDGVEVIALRPEKDDSDLMCCTKEAIRRGADDITYACASGGRIDHFLCNLSLLEYLHSCGVHGMLCDSRNRVTFHPGGAVWYQADASYRYVGIIPLDAELIGVTLRGLKYPLTDATVSRAQMITISNEPAAPEYMISVREGRSLVIESKDK
ncbi:MAG: thiamine diphosphokinase [Butyricicoccus porcorum]|uniref:thiamine diphosphokinase n=1 Tax=Butyricicoccus porcorum TaxID=1945634 RepID=UPI002A881D56|nr:thiamine diphosphokinase [Butyricicoccus porcorum]